MRIDADLQGPSQRLVEGTGISQVWPGKSEFKFKLKQWQSDAGGSRSRGILGQKNVWVWDGKVQIFTASPRSRSGYPQEGTFQKFSSSSHASPQSLTGKLFPDDPASPFGQFFHSAYLNLSIFNLCNLLFY